MSYAQPNDVILRYPNRDLVQLTNEDPSQQTVNTTFIQTHLNEALGGNRFVSRGAVLIAADRCACRADAALLRYRVVSDAVAQAAARPGRCAQALRRRGRDADEGREGRADARARE